MKKKSVLGTLFMALLTAIPYPSFSSGMQWFHQIVENVSINSTGQPERLSSQLGDIEIYPIQHASFVMKWNGKTIFVDPVGQINAYQSFAKADLLLITHDHRDHLNEEVIKAVSSRSTQLIVPKSVYDQLSSELQQIALVLANGESQSVKGIPVDAIAMYNTTADRLRFHPKGKGNGYVLTLGGKRIYISGDTEDISEMRALKKIDAAFLCMNLPYTMTVEQAASAVKAFRPKIVYPYHSRGSDLQQFKKLVGTSSEVRILKWYP